MQNPFRRLVGILFNNSVGYLGRDSGDFVEFAQVTQTPYKMGVMSKADPEMDRLFFYCNPTFAGYVAPIHTLFDRSTQAKTGSPLSV